MARMVRLALAAGACTTCLNNEIGKHLGIILQYTGTGVSRSQQYDVMRAKGIPFKAS
jgi:hypothetical protein